MPPRSPLPQRHGLDAAWVRTPDRSRPPPEPWSTMGSWLRERLPERVDVATMLGEGRFVYVDGRAVAAPDPYTPHTFVWFHRDLREEVTVPGTTHVLHRDERLVVVDKPPFLSTIPRGQHVQQSVIVLMRRELDLPELSSLHRLDRVTSGVLLLATERRWRSPYQVMFERRAVRKTYRALAPYRADLTFPRTVRDHLVKHRGQLQAEVVPEAPANAETLIELESRLDPSPDPRMDPGDLAVYRLSPRTGKTHQLRMHLNGLGLPIVGDPLYPVVEDVSVDDFSRPLQLLASDLEFVDPVDGTPRHFTSTRKLPLI